MFQSFFFFFCCIRETAVEMLTEENYACRDILDLALRGDNKIRTKNLKVHLFLYIQSVYGLSLTTTGQLKDQFLLRVIDRSVNAGDYKSVLRVNIYLSTNTSK